MDCDDQFLFVFRLFTLHNEKKKKVALYSVHINPNNLYEFAVSGRDQYAR